MHREIALSCVLLAIAAVFSVSSPIADAAPYTILARRQNGYWNQQVDDQDDAEMFLDVLARLGHIMRNQGLLNTKRGFDLGVTRGHSGSETSKMQMGLEVANYPGGPGRRRRSEQS